jgi:hypothetical protein
MINMTDDMKEIMPCAVFYRCRERSHFASAACAKFA